MPNVQTNARLKKFPNVEHHCRNNRITTLLVYNHANIASLCSIPQFCYPNHIIFIEYHSQNSVLGASRCIKTRQAFSVNKISLTCMVQFWSTCYCHRPMMWSYARRCVLLREMWCPYSIHQFKLQGVSLDMFCIADENGMIQDIKYMNMVLYDVILSQHSFLNIMCQVSTNT